MLQRLPIPYSSLFALVVAILFSAFAPLTYAGAATSSLDGQWQFSTDPEASPEKWTSLPVPGNWDLFNQYAQYRGKGYYQRSFTVDPQWKQRHVRIHFDMVDGDAQVWLNGQKLGSHHGGFLPFEFDVTNLIHWNQSNQLRICSDNSVKTGALWPWGGINGNVTLLCSDDLRIIHQHVYADLNLETGSAMVSGAIRVANDSDRPLSTNLTTAIEDTPATSTQQATVPPLATVDVPFRFELARQEVRRWDFDHPNLYRLKTRISQGDLIQDSCETHFGIRKVEATRDGLLLNGELVRLNGFNRINDHRAFGNTEPLHIIEQDVDLMKRYGANFMRICHTPQSPAMLDYLDERGMLIFEEIPVWGDHDANVKPNNPVTEQWLSEMIERDYNHPSIIGWSVGNEMIGHGPYVRSMISYIRQNLDSHRLLSYVSNSASWNKPSQEPVDAADLVLLNWYSTMAVPAKIVHGRWPNKPIFFSEYGSGQLGDSLSSLIPHFDGLWKGLDAEPYVIGASLWTFADYRSDFKGSSPSQLRSWGVVDQWRQPKAAAAQVQHANQPVRDLTIEGDRIQLVPRGEHDISRFTLRDYLLMWQWRDAKGKVQGGSVVPLPNIAPGGPAWSTHVGPPPANAEHAMLVASLINPVGYVVAESEHLSVPPSSKIIDTPPGAPVIRCVYPVDAGFYIAYVSQLKDTSVTVEYGTRPGEFSHQLTVALPGTVLIDGLENGKTYYARLRRNFAGGSTPWSQIITAKPDGGQSLPTPDILGVVRGPEGLAAISFTPVNKAVAYQVRYGNQSLIVRGSSINTIILRNLDEKQTYSFEMTALRSLP